MKVSIRATVFSVLAILLQIMFFVLFITLTEYGENGFPYWITNTTIGTQAPPQPLMGAFDDGDGELSSVSHKLTDTNNYNGDGVVVEYLRPTAWERARFFPPDGSVIPPLSDDPLEAPFYSPVPLSVMIFAGLGLLFSSIKCSSFSGLGLLFFFACFAFQWAALVVPWLFQAAVGIDDAKTIYYNVTTLVEVMYAVFAMMVAFGALVGTASRVQLLIAMLFGVVLYAVNRMVVIVYLVTLDLAGSMSVFAFGAFYGISISIAINFSSNCCCSSPSFIKKGSQAKMCCSKFNGYVENLLSLLGTILIFAHWPSFCAYLVPVSTDMYTRAIINTYFAMFSCVVMVYAVSTLLNKKSLIDIGHIQKATLAGGVAVASVAPLLLRPWGAILLGVLSGLLSVIFIRFVQPSTKKMFPHDTHSVLSTFGIPGIIGGVTSAVMAAMAESPLDYTPAEIAMFYPAIAGATGPGAPRSDTTQGGYQFAALITSIGIGIIGGWIVGIIIRYVGPLDEEEMHTDDTMFVNPYSCGAPCGCVTPCSPTPCQTGKEKI